MILFKACPRCGGDVDATFTDDVYCVQCAFRPVAVFPGPRILPGRPVSIEEERMDQANAKVICPKCGSRQAVRLEKLRPEGNTCYRCRPCGHVFSPRPRRTQAGGGG